jgi:hypothetical protein
MITTLRALSLLPGGGSAIVAEARRMLPSTPRSGKAGTRVADAIALLRTAEDATATPEARRAAAVEALCRLSAAVFWSAPPAKAHEVADAWDAARISSIKVRLGVDAQRGSG